MEKVLRIGARGSRLAVIQAEDVAARLRRAHPSLEVRIETFRTAGDRDRATPLAHLPGIGFFVKELETALLEGRIDLAVHSMKDVPTAVPEGLEVGSAVSEREDPRECLVMAGGRGGSGEPPRKTEVSRGLTDLVQGATIGTSSPRRRAMLLAARPDLAFIDLRGNVETRLAKLAAGACRATVLARAGLARLDLLDKSAAIARALDPEFMLPPAGQGALGLEHRAADDRVRGLLAPLDHAPSRLAVTAERALTRRLGAGCRTPLGVLARVEASGRLALEAWLLSPEGRESLRRQAAGPAAEAHRLGVQMAETLLVAGADRLMLSGGEADNA